MNEPIAQLLASLPHQTVLVDGPLHTVVRYAAAPDGPGATREIIAKFYRDGEAARAARIMDAVYNAVENSPASALIRVPRPLGFDADRQLVLQEVMSGVRFDELLSGPDVLSSLDLAGRALAAFHRLDIRLPDGRPRQIDDHILELIRPHPSRVADAIPDLAPRLGRILDRLFDLDRRWRPRRRDAAVHRDVHPKQLFLEGQRVCLIDWDLSAVGDAALDLGNLVAYLRARRAMNGPAVDALLGGYASSGATDVLQRVPLYEALTYVRLSSKRFRLAEPGWREECADLVARAERCLGLVN